ncbi:MAG: DUF1992 domain-containing protein [Paracoccus sp. (in: a-proteobacteria)]|nr:DUF1992 domain-containing protein [Paracoccus sp. (in: a-proteobacteria)]
MDGIEKLAQRRINAAEARGDLRGLAGEGQPLDPVRLREGTDDILHRIMAEAGALPQEIVLKKQVDAARALLSAINDPAERKRAQTEIALLEMRQAIAAEARRKFMR